MSGSLKKCALITGGSNGIGFAIAKKFSENNIEVIIADIKQPVKEITNVTFHYCDVSKGDEVNKLYAAIYPLIPDILVLNAGIGIHEHLTEGDPEKWASVLNINILGVLRCIRAFVPPMENKKKANVVFISSVAAKKAYSYGGVYAASKAAVAMIADTLRIETKPNIAITTIVAGVTDTAFFNDRTDRDHLFKNCGSLQAKDIADDVFYAISQPPGKTINSIMTRPSGQEF